MPWGAIAGAVVGGIFNKKSSGQSTVQSSEPWAGLQPYLTGQATVVDRFNPTPLNYNALAWAQNAAAGGTPGPAPALFMNDQRLTGENVQLPSGPGMFPPSPAAYSPFGQVAAQPAVPFNPVGQQSAVGNILNAPLAYSPFGGQTTAPQFAPIYSGGAAPMNYRDYAEQQGLALAPETDRFAPVIEAPPAPAPREITPRAPRPEHEGGRRCFIAGTQVKLADGNTVNIEDVQVGDILLGENNSENTVVAFDFPLLGNRSLYSINGSDPFVTGEHPFKTTNGWESFTGVTVETDHISIDKLIIGAELILSDSTTETLTAFEANTADANTQLYNFKLSGEHTYYANGYLVHNNHDNGETL